MNTPTTKALRCDAESIWRAGVAAVDSGLLVRRFVERRGDVLHIGPHEVDLRHVDRIAVVGAGKAGAGMAAAFEQQAGASELGERLVGWVNVPADCTRPLARIHLHAARPAGVNEPTAEGVAGARRILEIVNGLTDRDVCIVLLSGGGSALLPAPVDGVSLADKQAVTRKLMHGGATIEELNTVRKKLSKIKGGRLAQASNAGLTIALIISDVIGDPLDVIASGPTVPDSTTTAEALAVLNRCVPEPDAACDRVTELLGSVDDPLTAEPKPQVYNHVVGNNVAALEAAARRAEELGYCVHSLGSANAGEATQVGRELARLCVQIREHSTPATPPACVLSGGEPIVELADTDQPRKGGRNQQVALAAVDELWGDGAANIAILAGGTDGEDGPTDAAGGLADASVISSARSASLDPQADLAVNNSYPFLDATGGLFVTGPTHTNVMDLRVCLVR